MKRVMLLDQKGSALASDLLNQRILRELVISPYSATELARKLGTSVVKLWRRLSKLLEAGLIEQYRVEHVGNLEKRFYRASALRYLPVEFLQFEPRDEALRKAFVIYREIQKEGMKDLAASNEIRETETTNPVDYGVYEDLRSFCRVMQSPQTRELMKQLERQLSECRNFDSVPPIVKLAGTKTKNEK